MTENEAKDILKQVVSWRHDSLRGHPEMKYIAEAIEVVLKTQKSDDANEAAHEYAWEKQDTVFDAMGNPLMDYGPRYDSFLAGARWHGEQGIVIEGTVVKNQNTKHYSLVTQEDLKELGKIGEGKVEIQIRAKKEE